MSDTLMTGKRKRFAQRKLGWIGVDVGTSSLKIVQVARSNEQWQVAASAVVPRQHDWQVAGAAAEDAISSLDELKAARSLQEGYRGRSVAASLPMELCDVHRLDKEFNQARNPEQVLRQTIETATQQSAEHLQCDYWSASGSDGNPGWTQALTVSRHWTDRLCEDIAQAGWSCKAIDGLPLTMVRAVGMVHRADSPAPVAALDWGNSRATLCLIDKGQPAYVRCLKDCALSNLLAALVKNLRVTDLEAQRLLEDYGLSTAASERGSDVAQLVQEIIAEPISRLIEEIKRSFANYQYLRRASEPQCLYLFGGGAMIKQLADHLSTPLGVPTRKWQLPDDGTDQVSRDSNADCLLAPAIALSALAWEAS